MVADVNDGPILTFLYLLVLLGIIPNRQSLIIDPHTQHTKQLIKTKVGVTNGHTRVGFKIRSNPHLDFVLRDVVIVLAVPPDVDGERSRLSRPGGSWEELKRTVVWRVDEIAPGEALEIQAQFPLVEPTSSKTPRFPVLVRCSYSTLFCGMEIETADQSQPIRVEESGIVLHRKV